MEVDTNLYDEFCDIELENPKFKQKCLQLVNELKSNQTTILKVVQDLGPFLVDPKSTNRLVGIIVLTEVLENIPKDFLDEKQLELLCVFYTDRLKDNDQAFPTIFRGLLTLGQCHKFPPNEISKILEQLEKNVTVQQHLETDRLAVYHIFELLLQRFPKELSQMGARFVYTVISAIDGERNPKNLRYIFNWLPTFLKTVDLSHLSEDMFEVISCYFPVDYKASSQPSNGITREDLAYALAKCLTATPDFSEFCFPLAFEKFGSTLELAKIDALQLLRFGCETFSEATYMTHFPEMWPQLQQELFYNNLNPPLEEAALTTLCTIVAKISGEQNFGAAIKNVTDALKGNLLPETKFYGASVKLLLYMAKSSALSSDIITGEIAPVLLNMLKVAATPELKAIYLGTLSEFFQEYRQLHDKIEIEDLTQVPVLCVKFAQETVPELQIAGFGALSKICLWLTVDVRISIYKALKSWIVQDVIDIRDAFLNFFLALSMNFSGEVRKNIKTYIGLRGVQLKQYLNALKILVDLPKFTSFILDLYLANLKTETMDVTLDALQDLMQNEPLTLAELLDQKFVVRFLLYRENLNPLTTEKIGVILKSVIKQLSSNRQMQILYFEYEKIRHNLVLLDAVLASLRPDIPIPYEVLTEVAAFQTDKEIQGKLLGNLVNKCSDLETINNFLLFLEENNLLSFETEVWVTKGLVMRNHPAANIWVGRWIEQLKGNESVSRVFGTIIDSSGDMWVRSLFYQQRFFTIVVDKLTVEYKPEFPGFLQALGFMIEHVPKPVIRLQFKKILKLIVLALDHCENPEVLLTFLRVLNGLIIEKEECFSDNFSEFLTRILTLSGFPKSMKVRILALKTLQEYIRGFPVYKLLPYKNEVLQILAKIIDDKKRSVRKEAVEARCLWSLLDAPHSIILAIRYLTHLYSSNSDKVLIADFASFATDLNKNDIKPAEIIIFKFFSVL